VPCLLLRYVHSPCSLSGVVVLLTWFYVYYAAGSFTVWYMVLRGTCTVGRGFFTMQSSCFIAGVLYYMHYVCGCLFYPCGGVFCAAVCCHCLLATSLLGTVYR